MPSRRLLLLASFVLTACPASDDTADDVGDTAADDVGTAGDTTGADDGGTTASTLPGDSSGGSTGSGMPGPPEIQMITWTHAPGCVMNTGSDVEVVVTAVDPDNDVSELTFSGIAIGCTGDINMPMVTLLCPQVATYTANVTVEDPDGGTDSLEIMIVPCVDGMAP